MASATNTQVVRRGGCLGSVGYRSSHRAQEPLHLLRVVSSARWSYRSRRNTCHCSAWITTQPSACIGHRDRPFASLVRRLGQEAREPSVGRSWYSACVKFPLELQDRPPTTPSI